MLALLLRVLGELFLHRLAGEPGRTHRVELVAQHADDLGGHRMVQEGDGVLHLAPVVRGYGAGNQMLPGPAADLLDIGEKRPESAHGLAPSCSSIGDGRAPPHDWLAPPAALSVHWDAGAALRASRAADFRKNQIEVQDVDLMSGTPGLTAT